MMTASLREGLTGDFNQLVADMGAVAAHFGESVLGRVNADEFFRQLPAVRRACGPA